MTTTSLVVAIPTYKRPATLAPNLHAVLDQIATLAQDTGLDVHASVTVVDNDPAASARTLVTQFDGVRYVHQPAPGIVMARNAALTDAADADLLVFIDDDEYPEPQWLAALVRTWQSTHADAVWGHVVALFDHEPDPWITAGGFFTRAARTTGTRVPAAACGNLLVSMHAVRRYGLRFDPRMAMGAGEDTLFTRTLCARGGTIVWCQESAVQDIVATDRLTRRWVLARAASHGNAAARIDRMLAASPPGRWAARAKAVTGGLTRIVMGAGRYALGIARRSLPDQARGARMAYRGIGLVTGGLGLVYQEYARSGRTKLVGERTALGPTKG